MLIVTKMKQEIETTVEIPDGIQVTGKNDLTVKGPKGELKRTFNFPGVQVVAGSKEIVISAKKATKREKKIIYTYGRLF